MMPGQRWLCGKDDHEMGLTADRPAVSAAFCGQIGEKLRSWIDPGD
jgi:hypothetical protein